MHFTAPIFASICLKSAKIDSENLNFFDKRSFVAPGTVCCLSSSWTDILWMSNVPSMKDWKASVLKCAPPRWASGQVGVLLLNMPT